MPKPSLILAPLFLAAQLLQAEDHSADIIIYGGTSASVIAAVQAKKMGKSAIVVSPDKRIGGLSSGGLGFTDTGNKTVIGGLSRNFYQRIYKHYEDDVSWKWQKREDYGDAGQGNRSTDHGQRTMWIFEPSAALGVFEDYSAGTVNRVDLGISSVSHFGLRTVNLASPDTLNFDEVRIGTTFDSVVVPEPSIALLGAIGMLALLRLRRA